MNKITVRINIVVGGTFHFPILLRNLESLGYDVHVYTSTPKFKFKSEFDKRTLTTVIKPFQIFSKLTGYNVPRWADTIDEILFDGIVSRIMRPCDILIGFQNASLFTGRQVKSDGGIFLLDRACPHVQVISDRLSIEAAKIGLTFKRPNRKQMRRYIEEYHLADKILIPSDYSINTFKMMGLPAEKIAKIPLAAKTKIPKTLSPKPTKLVVGMIGNDLLRKGLYYLIKAFDNADLEDSKLLLKTSKQAVLAHPELKKIVEGNKNIEFCGYVENVNDFYEKCSVFCLPSIDDGFGMVVCEAMANGLPIITTDCTGASELIEDNVNGFVVSAGDIEDLRGRLEYFFKNPEDRARMGKEARSLYLTYLDSDTGYKSQMGFLIDGLIASRTKI